MEDLLEILTDVYHWIKNDRDEGGEIGLELLSYSLNEMNMSIFFCIGHLFRTNAVPLASDRSSVPASSLGAQIAQLADRRRAFGQDIVAPNSLVYTEISPIVSPSNSPSRKRQQDNIEHDPVIEDLQEKYQSLLRRFEKTVQMSSDALNLSRLSQGLSTKKNLYFTTENFI
jgi:hypothetical protein